MARTTDSGTASTIAADGSRTRLTAVRLTVSGLVLFTIFLLIAAQASALQPRSFRKGTSTSAPSGAGVLCRTYAWACSVSSHASSVSTADLAVVDKVNRAINRSVRFLADRRQFRVEESWSLPTERGGDCEDFVLLKKRELIGRGFPAQALLIATALDRQRRGHAVLIVRTHAGDLVLDNVTDGVKKWSDTGYIFLRMQNPASPNRWINVVSAN